LKEMPLKWVQGTKTWKLKYEVIEYVFFSFTTFDYQ
jgi:hypothetical protein